MSTIRTVQTKLRAPPSFNVLGAIDTNSPPGLPYRAQEIDLYFEKPSQPSYSSFSTPTPVNNSGSFSRRNAASTSSLSPYASPYKPRSAPRSTNTSSQFHAQNQYHLQSQRAGARAGRGAPSLSSYASQGYDSELPGVNYSQTSSGGHNNVGGSLLMDPIFNGVPTYSLSSRFDPFGDLSASEKTSIPSHKNRTTFTPSPANSTALTQSPGAGTGREPAYTHYYYYDKSTNSPMLAYGARQSNNNRINLNHPHNQSNPKFRGNNNTLQTRNHYNNRRPSSFSPSRSPSPPSTVQVNQQASFISFPNTTPSRSPSPPSSIGISLPLSVTPKTEGNLPVDPLPAPVRTRKRSNAFREPPKAVQPTVPSSSPPPEIKPKVVQKKDDSSMASKLVAAMLLNRVDATGRSRCAGSATKRLGLGAGYVKSGLSRVVFVEC